MYRKRATALMTLASILFFGVISASAAIRTATLRVKGMTCGGCATSVEKALKETEGVVEVHVNFERGRAVVRYDDQKVTVAKLREVIQSTGFSCEVGADTR